MVSSDIGVLEDVTATEHGIRIRLPDGSVLVSTHTANLPNKKLSPAARRCDIFPGMVGQSLISIGQLCDGGCEAKYTKEDVTITLDGETICTGLRSPATRLWEIPLPFNASVDTGHNQLRGPDHTANNVIRLDSEAQFVSFVHKTYGSPTVKTFHAAVTKGLIKVPGLTAAMIHRHPPDTANTAKGHLKLQRQGQRSTKEKEAEPETEEDQHPTSPSTTKKTNRVYCKVFEECHGHVYVDPTGKFPVTSITGAKYVLIMFHEDTNSIHAEPMNSRMASEYVAALARGEAVFEDNGFKITCEHFDNEFSKLLAAHLKKQDIEIQLVPANNHRTNRAERAIGTFKGHFISMLCSADPDFPLRLWCKLLPHANCTLNQMRSSRVVPNLSAWDHLHRKAFDYRKTPLAPAGMKVVIHESADTRPSWATHGVDGFYLGTSLLHYRGYTCWATETNAVRITDTVAWFPTDVHMPGSSVTEDLTRAMNEVIATLTKLIKSPGAHSTSRGPLLEHLDLYTHGWKAMRDIFFPPTTPKVTPEATQPVAPEAAAAAPPPRVAPAADPSAAAPPPRVAPAQTTAAPPPRVDTAATPAPEYIRTTNETARR